MSPDLTDSPVARQNILNNPYTLRRDRKSGRNPGHPVRESNRHYVRNGSRIFFGATTRTVDNDLERFGEELRQIGYEVLRCKPLQGIKLAINEMIDHETSFVIITTVLAILDS